MVYPNQVIDFTVTFVLQETGELAVEVMNFSCIFGRLKVWICKIMAYEEWSIINDVWTGFMNEIEGMNIIYTLGLRPRA